MKYLLDAGWSLTLPAGPSDHVAARIVARGPAADVSIIERVHIRQLHGVITVLVDLGHAKDNRFGTKINLEHGVWCIAVGSNDSGVLRGEHLGVANDLVERAFVLGVGFVDIELIHGLVGSDHREAVNVGLLVGVFVRNRLTDGIFVLAARHDPDQGHERNDEIQFSSFHQDLQYSFFNWPFRYGKTIVFIAPHSAIPSKPRQMESRQGLRVASGSRWPEPARRALPGHMETAADVRCSGSWIRSRLGCWLPERLGIPLRDRHGAGSTYCETPCSRTARASRIKGNFTATVVRSGSLLRQSLCGLRHITSRSLRSDLRLYG